MDVLKIAREYQQIELDTLESLSTSGAGLPIEAVADIKERLAFRRSYVCSVLVSAYNKASEEKRKEIKAALILVNSAARLF